jgi:hypothetical protein
MQQCQIPREDYLPPQVIHLTIEDERCDLECARQAAIEEAMQYDNAPRLVSWFDRRGENFSTRDRECRDGEPSWVLYAEDQGADLTIDINNEDYVFIFRKSHGLP